MRLWHTVAGAALGSAGAALVIAVLSRMWRSCDVGVNASANAGALLYGYGPAVAVAIALPTIVILAVGDRRPGITAWTGAVSRAAAGAVAVALALLICWIALSIGHDPGRGYPSPHCVDNVPDWWPAWIPL